MIFDGKGFARKYALLYASIVSVVMLVPLFVYIQLMLGIDEAKMHNALVVQARNIVLQMESYDPSDRVPFRFPRYVGYRAGLYDGNMRPIFTLLDYVPPGFSPGYHKYGDRRYYVMRLPAGRYFDASYLLVSTTLQRARIAMVVVLSVAGIVVTLFLLTWMVFRHFARPFEMINRQLDNFIKDSMHEINTPLSIIQLNADLFARRYGVNKYIPRIKAAAKTLATIYNDMDYLIKKERMIYPKESIDFTHFLRERVDYFKEVASLREVIIETEIEKSVSIRFNPTKLQRIVDNTLSNAIKYSHERGRITVKLVKEDEKVRFEVEDRGIGMKDPRKVFARYYREDSFKGGFGIGLSIVKNIADSEGVTIQVHSEVGQGSSFAYIFDSNNL